MKTALSLVLVGILSRWLPHPPNAVALGAVALYAGARLPRRWAVLVPLAALLISDLALDWINGYRFDIASRLTTYATFSAIALAGGFARSADAPTRVVMSLGASTFFFLVSNFAVWAEGSGWAMPASLDGLFACYAVAVPFYFKSLVADLAGTGILFGLDAAFARKVTPVAAVAELSAR